MDATNNFVLDESATMVPGFEDEADEYAEAILERTPYLQAHVPYLTGLLEVANALLVGEHRRRITSAETARFIAILGAYFPLPSYDQTVAHACGLYHAFWLRDHNLSFLLCCLPGAGGPAAACRCAGPGWQAQNGMAGAMGVPLFEGA